MKQTRLIMGMPITLEITSAKKTILAEIFSYFEQIDETFSTYKKDSEISRINRKEISLRDASADVKTVFALAEETKQQTRGYFNIVTPQKQYNPSGLVKGWAIYEASKLLLKKGFEDFFIDAGGDVQAARDTREGKFWTVGIRHPFQQEKIVKVLHIRNEGVATSGTYIRGQHIYNPHDYGKIISDIVSLTVVGPNIYEADRFATAAFAMGEQGIFFIEHMPGLEAYMIDKNGIATETTGFKKFVG